VSKGVKNRSDVKKKISMNLKEPVSKNNLRSRWQPDSGTRVHLGERDAELLTALFLHGAMSRAQIQALYFSGVSLTRCNGRLRQLFDGGYVTRHTLPLAPTGAQAIYSLGRAAAATVAACLSAQGLEADAADIRAQCREGLAPMFLEHTLAIVDFHLALRHAVSRPDGAESEPETRKLELERRPKPEIERWLPERLCRHEYEVRPPGGGSWQKEAFKPDGFVRLSMPSKEGEPPAYFHYFVEIDRGHVSSAKFLGKLRGHSRYLDTGLFQETFGGASFQTLVITTSPARLQNLAELVAREGSTLFWLTTFDAVT